MYEYEIRNGIDRNSHLRMIGYRSEVIRYLKDDYSGGSTKILLDGRKFRAPVVKIRVMRGAGLRGPVVARYSTG